MDAPAMSVPFQRTALSPSSDPDQAGRWNYAPTTVIPILPVWWSPPQKLEHAAASVPLVEFVEVKVVEVIGVMHINRNHQEMIR